MTMKRFWTMLVALIVVAFVAWRLIGRSPAEADDPNRGLSADGVITAAVVRVQRGNLGNTLTIAGEFKPFQEVDIHAKVAGYIRVIRVDVGDRVKEGQVLAELEIPELSAQLAGTDAMVRRAQEEIRRAKSDVERAQSAHSAAHSGYIRLKQAADSRPGLVAQQEVDDSQAKDLESEAQVASAQAEASGAQQQLEVAQANQKQYGALSNYSHIVAPFAGVITKRFADTGALIQAGTASNTQAMPLVRLAQTSKLRLVLPIPESVSGQIQLGQAVKVRVQALNQDIEGKVSRFADSLDRQTRTMETEIDFENSNGELIPGMYAEAVLSLREKKDVLTVPIEAVSRDGNEGTALLVNSWNTIEERRLKLGVESGTRIEVISGLSEHDRIVIGSRSLFRVGQQVQPKETTDPESRKRGS
jgi:RND family efflux transporter MFP subunit